MEQEVLQRRNIVFNRLYHHSLALYKSCVPKPVRFLMEIYFLFLALLTLFLWGYVHFTYIMSSEDCLVSITDRPFPRDIILQVEVYSNTSEVWHEREKALENLYNSIHSNSQEEFRDQEFNRIDWIEDFCEKNLLINLTGTKLFCAFILYELYSNGKDDGNMLRDEEVSLQNIGVENVSQVDGDSPETKESDYVEMPFTYNNHSENVISKSNTSLESNTDSHLTEEERRNEFYAKNRSLYELFDYYSLQFLAFDYTILEFSQEPGYLSLTDSARTKLNISVVKLYIDPNQSSCFGGPLGKFLTKYFFGYEMMVIASYKGLLPSGPGSGYVKNLLTGSQYYYKVQWMGKWRYGAGLLPALFFTLVASVLLRQVHYHIFKFLTHFNHLLNQGIPMPIQTGAQIPFLIVTYATIGLVIVMSEALSDDSVFSLLMVGTVWEVDQFYSIYCRQETSKTYLPWFFFLYHFLPYAYYIRFNGQFWFIPFAFHWLLLQHAMLYFLHHCELPALDQVHRVNPVPIHPPPLQPPLLPPNLAPIVPQPLEEPNVPITGEVQVDAQHADFHLRHETDENPLSGSDQTEEHGRHRAEDESEVLRRSQLHSRIGGSNSEEYVVRTISAPVLETKPQTGPSQQLSDDQLRKIRLQRFENKHI